MSKLPVVTLVAALILLSGPHAEAGPQALPQGAPPQAGPPAPVPPASPRPQSPPVEPGTAVRPMPPQQPGASRVVPAVQPEQEEVTQNIRLDLSIVDTQEGESVTKDVSMLIWRRGSSIRSEGGNPGGAKLNIDATARLRGDGLIDLDASFQYFPGITVVPEGPQPPRPAELGQRISVLLENGVELLVSQSADPSTDRTVSVTVKATVIE